MNEGWLERINRFMADNQRPYTTYVLTTAIAIGCLIKDIAPIAIPVAGAALGISVASRSVEKVNQSNKDADVKKTEINVKAS